MGQTTNPDAVKASGKSGEIENSKNNAGTFWQHPSLSEPLTQQYRPMTEIVEGGARLSAILLS